MAEFEGGVEGSSLVISGSGMSQHGPAHSRTRRPMRAAGRLLIAAIVILAAVSIDAKDAQALSLGDYFSYTYTIDLSTTDVQGSETFFATASGRATAIQDLPITPTQAYVTSRIIARHDTSGTEIVLNASYTVTVDNVPSVAGDTAEETVSVPLSFPVDSEPGTYEVTGQLIEAKVQVLVFWLDVSGMLPASQSVGSITYTLDDSGGASDDEDAVLAGTGDLSADVTDAGEFIRDVVVESSDGSAAAVILQGTTGLTAGDLALRELTITRMEDPPPPLAETVLGAVYDFGPDGATFDRPIGIRLAYDEASLPDGVAEGNLVLAVWDRQAEEWLSLATTVDAFGNTVGAEVTHFTPYAIVIGTRPARFTLGDILVTPASIGIGQTVTIWATAANDGDLTGTYHVALDVDGVTVAVQYVPLAGGQERGLVFTASADVVGEHTVTLGSLSGTFTVTADQPSPAPASFTTSVLQLTPAKIISGGSTSVSVVVTNTGDVEGATQVVLRVDDTIEATAQVVLAGGASTTVVFVVSRDSPGVYTTSVGDLAQILTVDPDETTSPPDDSPPPDDLPPPVTPAAVSGRLAGLIGGAVGATVVVLLAALFRLLSRRRRA